jgi:voltage-gated potassium channel Kch
MLINLLTSLPAMLLCLALQAVFVAVGVKQFVLFRDRAAESHALLRNVALLSVVMLVMLVGNVIQMAIWATLFTIIGEFDQFAKALYFSSVTFATLGYGDVVLSERWRLLSGVEAANGILMFGVSTAVMTAAVLDVMKRFETGGSR